MLAFQARLLGPFGLCEVRHVSVDHAWRDCVYTNAPWPENGSPVFDKGFYCSLGCRVGKDRRLVQIGCANYGAGPERRDHNDVRAFTKDGQELLHQKKRTSHIRCKEIVKFRSLYDL